MSGTSQQGTKRDARLARAAKISGSSGKLCPADRATALLEAIIEPGDRVTIEGDNQKQADFLAAALAKADPARLHDLHMVQSVLALPDHLAVFERGIANAARLRLRRPAGRAARRAGHRAARSRSARSTPISNCSPATGRPDAACGLIVAQGATATATLHRPQHRGHADHRRSDSLPQRHRDGAGQRGPAIGCRASTSPATGSISS